MQGTVGFELLTVQLTCDLNAYNSSIVYTCVVQLSADLILIVMLVNIVYDVHKHCTTSFSCAQLKQTIPRPSNKTELPRPGIEPGSLG